MTVRLINLAGKRFGRLVVVSVSGKSSNHVRWLCKCDCGNRVSVLGGSLRSGRTASCGCFRKEVAHQRMIVDMLGKVFGKLTPIALAEKKEGSHLARWLCRCDCGREIVVAGARMRTGNSLSCGCTRLKHGRSRTHEYRTWKRIKERCLDPRSANYARYGGRGIVVDPSWVTDFQVFLSAVGLAPSTKHTIDRIDNNRGYVPGNVRWATAKEQARNRRTTRLISFRGQTLPLAEWADRMGASRDTLYNRVFTRGWSAKKALTTPVQHYSHKTAMIR